jgi:hypothetical protein
MRKQIYPEQDRLEEPTMEKMEEEYRPTKAELLRDHEIIIRFLNRGCIVRVGCKEIAFTDSTEAMAEINKYVNDPYEAQKEWRKILG